jgi:hypothetical protein
LSRFENFFNKTKTPAEKKEEAAAPAEATTEPTPEAATLPTVTEPAAEEAAAPVEEKKEAEATTPTKERKPSFLNGIKSFTQKVRSPSSEQPPAEPSTAIETAEAPAATEEPAAAAAEPTETPATTEAAATSPTDTKEKRRSSLFDFKSLQGKLASKPKAEPLATAEEPATTEEPAKPAEEAAAVEEPAKTSTEEKAAEKAPKEHKESPITQLGRRFSKAIRGGAKREPKTPAKVDEAESEATKTEPISAEAPQLPKDEPSTETPAAIGDVVPEAVTVGTAPPASTTVSATA